MKIQNIYSLIIVLFALLLYAQSVSFGFVYDDSAVTYDNKIIKEGIQGIPTLLTTDYWYGFTPSERVAEYRPASLVMFATEWQIYKDNPHYFHAVNILLFAFICWLIFSLFCKLFDNKNLLFPFICTLLYASHPIHTEVVDNIKSGDELLCFLFALVSVLLLLKSLEKKSNKGTLKILLLAAISYFFCLLSKETGIAFVLIIPLVLYVFTNTGWKKIMMITGIYASILIVFLFIHYSILKDIKFHNPSDSFSNSLLAAPDIFSQKATAFYILFRYIILLIFPYPLTYDYSVATIPIFKVTDIEAILSILIYFVLGLYALVTIRKKNPVAFAILFYLITLFPVSNLLIIIGSPMAERFLFMPSLGYTMILTFILLNITYSNNRNGKENRITVKVFGVPTKYPKTNTKYLFIFVFIIVGLYSIQTINRSRCWKDNHILYAHDVKISDRSARTHFNYGCALFDLFSTEKNEALKQSYLDKSIMEYKEALKYYPNYADALVNLGFAYLNQGNYTQAIPLCSKAIEINPDYERAYLDEGCAYIDLKEYDKGLKYLNKAYLLDSLDPEVIFCLGAVYHNMSKLEKGQQLIDRANRMKNASF